MPFQTIPKPRKLGQRLLNAQNIQLPDVVPDHGVIVSPRKKLVRHASKRHMAMHNQSENTSPSKF